MPLVEFATTRQTESRTPRVTFTLKLLKITHALKRKCTAHMSKLTQGLGVNLDPKLPFKSD